MFQNYTNHSSETSYKLQPTGGQTLVVSSAAYLLPSGRKNYQKGDGGGEYDGDLLRNPEASQERRICTQDD